MDDDVICEIRRLSQLVDAHASSTAVLAVINVKSRTRRLADYTHHSMRTSFLNDEEIDAILQALRECGFYAQHFADEEDFFRWALSGGPSSLGMPLQVVYTSALNGAGPGRRTLVPAFCAYRGLPTVNSDAYSCAINRQKFHVARLLQTFGVPVPRSWYFLPGRGWWDGQRPERGVPVIAKATYEGSSVGVDPEGVGPFSSRLEERIAFLAESLRQPMTVQALIAGFELEVPLVRLGTPRAIGVAALTLGGSARLDDRVLLYDEAFEDAYGFEDATELLSTTAATVQRLAERAADVLNFRGISRIDFRVTAEGEPYLIDVSSTPHLTPANSTSYLFARAGLAYRDIFRTLVGLAAERHGLYSSDQNSSSDARNPRP